MAVDVGARLKAAVETLIPTQSPHAAGRLQTIKSLLTGLDGRQRSTRPLVLPHVQGKLLAPRDKRPATPRSDVAMTGYAVCHASEDSALLAEHSALL